MYLRASNRNASKGRVGTHGLVLVPPESLTSDVKDDDSRDDVANVNDGLAHLRAGLQSLGASPVQRQRHEHRVWTQHLLRHNHPETLGAVRVENDQFGRAHLLELAERVHRASVQHPEASARVQSGAENAHERRALVVQPLLPRHAGVGLQFGAF